MVLQRLCLVASLASLLALAACGGSEGPPAVPTADSPAAEARSPTPEDQVFRDRLLNLALGLEDLPEGLILGLEKFISNEDGAAAAGLSLDEVEDWGRILGYRATYGSATAFESPSPGDLLIVEVGVELFQTPEGARQSYEFGTNASVEELKERIVSQHPELRDVQVEEIDFPELGDDSAAWRVSAEITLSGGPTYRFVSTPVTILSGSVAGVIDVQYAYTPDEDQIEALVRRFAAKLSRSP